MSEFRKVIGKAGEIIDFETVFEEHPGLRTAVAAKRGTTEIVEYDTAVYENGITYHKYCYVYLPNGYDPEDKSKRYNVLYYQHGNTCEPSIFARGGNEPMIDMLFESGEIEPCIIVSTTYYMNPIRDTAERMKSGMVEAGDGFWKALPPYFYREVVESIIPAVETRYNTYLESATEEGIKASRDHRAFSGYSRGGAMTWRMIHHSFDYFRWYVPISCDVFVDNISKADRTDQNVIDYVTAPIKANPELPFFIYACNGGQRDIVEMTREMGFLTKEPCFSYGDDPTANNIYFCVSDYYHTDYLVPYYYWNALKVLFKGV